MARNHAVLQPAVANPMHPEWDDAPRVIDCWIAFMLDLERLPLAERIVPAEQHEGSRLVVYFHVLEGALRYIGQTTDIERRRIAHRRDGRDWDEEWVLPAPADWPWLHRANWLDAVENGLIRHLEPPHNHAQRYSPFTDDIIRHLGEHPVRQFRVEREP